MTARAGGQADRDDDDSGDRAAGDRADSAAHGPGSYAAWTEERRSDEGAPARRGKAAGQTAAAEPAGPRGQSGRAGRLAFHSNPRLRRSSAFLEQRVSLAGDPAENL